MSNERVVDWIVKEEGFKRKPYFCSERVATFGHGLTYIEESESLSIVKNRIKEIRYAIEDKLDSSDISLDGFRIDVLVDMGYQLGFNGLIKFKDMWSAIKDMNYDKAADAMLDSKWHIQTPVRCELLAKRMRFGYDNGI